jgi:hypothetical protein
MFNANELKKIYVDVDGTLLCGSLDLEFKERCSVEEFKTVLEWYENCQVDNLRLNVELLRNLKELKEDGFELILWTNRGEANKDMTKRNLGEWWNLFDSHEFHDGQKGKCKLDGLVIDNEDKYLSCGKQGILIKF